MNSISMLSNIVGLYGLTKEGVLGVYNNEKQLVPDAELTEAFASNVRQLLTSYVSDSAEGKYRLGIIYRPATPRPWDSDTLVLEKTIVRELYPVGGPPSQELTTFQKKNREKSIYRGMELLVDYRYDTHPDDPVYCPLLFDWGASLADYPSKADFGSASDTDVPVVEILNLMSTIPLGRRNTPAVGKLVDRLHQYLGRKDVRRDKTFTFAAPTYSKSTDTSGAVEFFDVDKRHERKQTLETGQRMAAVERTEKADHFHQVQQWLERPHRPVDPALLRGFTQFRDLPVEGWALLIERALVHTAPAGAKLLNIGMKDSWNMYLLEGTLSLQAEDGGALFVTGGSDKASSPISFLKPRKYNVTAVTSVSFLWIHDALLQAVLVPPGPRPQTVSALKPPGFSR